MVLLQTSTDDDHTRNPYVEIESTYSQLPNHKLTLTYRHNILCQHYHVFLRRQTLHQIQHHRIRQRTLRLSHLCLSSVPIITSSPPAENNRRFGERLETDDYNLNYVLMCLPTTDTNIVYSLQWHYLTLIQLCLLVDLTRRRYIAPLTLDIF